jgi:hypothetical protein
MDIKPYKIFNEIKNTNIKPIEYECLEIEQRATAL